MTGCQLLRHVQAVTAHSHRALSACKGSDKIPLDEIGIEAAIILPLPSCSKNGLTAQPFARPSEIQHIEGV